MFNGVYSLSVSPNRLTYQMLGSHTTLSSIIEPRVSLSGRKVDDIATVLQGLLKSKIITRFPTCFPSPFNQEAYNLEATLKIGYFDGECCNAMKRAILTSYGHLASSGHELIKISASFPLIDEIFEISLQLYVNLYLIGMQSIIPRPEEQTSEFRNTLGLIDGAGYKSTLSKVLKMRSHSQRSKILERAFVTFKTSAQLLQAISRLDELKEKALIELNRQCSCDIFICPVFPVVAPP